MFKLGFNVNTYTIMGRCTRTGRLGIALTTREVAVGSTVTFVKSGVGAVATQARTDPRLGHLGLNLLDLGYPAGRVIAEMESCDRYIERRQLGIIDRWGNIAVRTGSENLDWAGHITGDDYIAMGNNLTSERTAEAMAETMEGSSADEDLEQRLLRCIESGTAAGGQKGGQHSSALVVYEDDVYPHIDLRVDDHEEPVGELRRIFDKFYPLLPYYKLRADDPTIPTVDVWAKERGSST